MTLSMKKGEERHEADTLAEYAEYEDGLEPDQLILLIKDLITDKYDRKSGHWSWKVVEYIAQKTGAVEIDYDVDVETGDWGLPVYSGGPTGYSVTNRKYLIKLLEYLEDKHNDTFMAITLFFRKEPNPRWVCKSCGRFLGKRLRTYEEVQKLLTDFSIGKYWKCRSCKKNNWFEISKEGVADFFCS